MTDVGDMILQLVALSTEPGPWPTLDPFLFCVHHNDAYPQGTTDLTPPDSLDGRAIGSDFSGKDGWSMYHGSSVPGFPQHPHRGFETISYMRQGFMDHSDSLGAAARFGRGDVQWMTAGEGVQHSEMFPLLDQQGSNPTELFQIWINLPADDKMVPAHFAMLWDHDIPKLVHVDDEGREVEVTVIAGPLENLEPASPPPHSWASRDVADVAIWNLSLAADATWALPPSFSEEAMRTLYIYGGAVVIDGQEVGTNTAVVVRCDVPVDVRATHDGHADVLLLQGVPIGEPVAQHGPMVMNTEGELRQAFADYRRTGFGGWPWATSDPNHGPELRRFARHADGRVEEFVVAR